MIIFGYLCLIVAGMVASDRFAHKDLLSLLGWPLYLLLAFSFLFTAYGIAKGIKDENKEN